MTSQLAIGQINYANKIAGFAGGLAEFDNSIVKKTSEFHLSFFASGDRRPLLYVRLSSLIGPW